MDKNLMMSILIEDRNTPSEAKKRINDTSFPAFIYEDFNDYINEMKASGVYAGETVEDAKAGKIRDLLYVRYNGHDYFIVYVN